MRAPATVEGVVTPLTSAVMAVIQARMKALDMTQAELAEYVGVRQPTISRWLRGQGSPTLDDVHNIAHALRIPAKKLLK